MFAQAGLWLFLPGVAFASVVGQRGLSGIKGRDITTTYTARFEGLLVNVPPPRPYQGLNWDGVNVNVNNGGILPIRITDVLTSDGSNYIATAPLSSIKISIANPSQTFSIRELSVGIFLQTGIGLARPAMNGRVVFYGTESNGVFTTYESVQFTGDAHSLLSLSLEAGGFVLVGAYSMQRKTLTETVRLKSLEIWPVDTTLTVGPVNLAQIVGGVFLDNITYDIITHT